MNRTLKIVLIVILVGASIGAFVAYKMWNKPFDDVTDMEGMKVNADVLYKAFETNEQTANTTYVGKVVEVSGTVGDIETSDTIARVMITFPDAMMGAVRVTLDSRHLADAKAVKTGDQATFKGFCNGFLMDVEIKDGVLIKK
jgi:hypothetical protein